MSGDFAIGLFTIITGLAIADVVKSLHALLIERKNVRWDWLPLLATLFIVILIIAIWGFSYRSIGGQEYHAPLWEFAARLAQIFPMYLAARAILPDSVPEGGLSLADHYAAVSRYFWGSIAVTYAAHLAFVVSEVGPGGLPRTNPSPAIQLVMMVSLIIFRTRKLHMILVPISFALLCYNQLMRPLF